MVNMFKSKILPFVGSNRCDGNVEESKKPMQSVLSDGIGLEMHKPIKKHELSSSGLSEIVGPVKMMSTWKHLSSKRRMFHIGDVRNTFSEQALVDKKMEFYVGLNSVIRGISSDIDEQEISNECESVSGEYKLSTRTFAQASLSKVSKKALIIYFAKFAQRHCESDELDLDFIESLIRNGADVNSCDKYGQTVLHECARSWHPDVAKFLITQGADVNQSDKYGRTPLHVAAAVNYAEMVEYLVGNGANIQSSTYGECQMPIHYAAKNDATDALKQLIKLGAGIEDRDSKQRTPLQVASELDRSDTANYLVKCGADVGVVDFSGLSVLTLMIEKMPLVAKQALDKLHHTDRLNRKQFFYLNLLEPKVPDRSTSFAKSPLIAAVRSQQMELILHPVLRRLVDVKWKAFGRRSHCISLFANFLFILVWSLVGGLLPKAKSSQSLPNYYDPLSQYWWRVLLELAAVAFAIYYVLAELLELRSSSTSHRQWQAWRLKQLESDLMYCHPQWPDERKYLLKEMKGVKESRQSYFTDAWNIVDWVTYLSIVCVVVTRLAAVGGNVMCSRWHAKVLAVSLIFIWLRLMKTIRAFQALGPFIVMIGHIVMDTVKFCFLFMEFFVPYVLAFWILFGGAENAEVMEAKGQSSKGWRHFDDLVYSVWLITVVGDFDFAALSSVDPVMARVLTGSFTALSGIVLLNLFIALMSDTFQRVYDNAKANALMQRALSVLHYESSLGRKAGAEFRSYLHRCYAPEQVFYDDDSLEEGGELEKMTIQIKEVVDEIKEIVQSNKLISAQESASTKVDLLRKDLRKFMREQEKELAAVHRRVDALSKLVMKLGDCDEEMIEGSAEDPNGASVGRFTACESRTTLPEVHELRPNTFKRNGFGSDGLLSPGRL